MVDSSLAWRGAAARRVGDRSLEQDASLVRILSGVFPGPPGNRLSESGSSWNQESSRSWAPSRSWALRWKTTAPSHLTVV